MERATPTPTIPIDVLSDAVRQHVASSTPVDLRLMAAKALVPMAPFDLLASLLFLERDAAPTVAHAATASLAELPDDILVAAAQTQGPEEVLDGIAKRFSTHGQVPESLVLNRKTPDQSFVYLAEHSHETRLLEMIAGNQHRLLRSPHIIEALYLNGQTPMSTCDRIVEFAVRNRVVLKNIPVFQEMAAALGLQVQFEDEVERAVAEAIDEPVYVEPEAREVPEEYDLTFKEVFRLSVEESRALGIITDREVEVILDDQAEEQEEEEPADELGNLEDLLTGANRGARYAKFNKDDPLMVRNLKDRRRLIAKLNSAQRVRLAILGTKTDRALLVRDPQKVVAMAVIKSPKVSDMEIAAYAANRSLHEDIVGYIASNKRWMRNYRIKLALVQNPKTPVRKAMNLLSHIRSGDLKTLAMDKNISQVIAEAAKNMIKTRGDGR